MQIHIDWAGAPWCTRLVHQHRHSGAGAPVVHQVGAPDQARQGLRHPPAWAPDASWGIEHPLARHGFACWQVEYPPAWRRHARPEMRDRTRSRLVVRRGHRGGPRLPEDCQAGASGTPPSWCVDARRGPRACSWLAAWRRADASAMPSPDDRPSRRDIVYPPH